MNRVARYGGAWVGVLGLVLGTWLVAEDAGAALDPAGPVVGAAGPPPADSVEALWAGPLSTAEADPDVALRGHAGLAVAAAARPSTEASVAGHRALAAASLDPALAGRLRRSETYDAAELAWLTDPALLAAARSRCPALGEPCGDAWLRTGEAAVDAVLVDALVDPDPAVAAAALRVACRLGATRGVDLAEGVAPPASDVRARAVSSRVRSCAVGTEALALLEADLGPRDRLAPVSALEMWRLGARPELLEKRVADGTVTGIIAGLGEW